MRFGCFSYFILTDLMKTIQVVLFYFFLSFCPTQCSVSLEGDIREEPRRTGTHIAGDERNGGVR